MKLLAATAALLIAAPALAQTAPTPAAPQPSAPMAAPDTSVVAAVPTVTAPAAALNIDTPIETLAANEAARAVLNSALPSLLTHPAYDQFKGLSLNQLAPYSQGMLTPALLTQVATGLAAIR